MISTVNYMIKIFFLVLLFIYVYVLFNKFYYRTATKVVDFRMHTYLLVSQACGSTALC